MKLADLHIHSFYSDGSFSAKEIFELSKKEGLSCISVTDHDSFDFYSPQNLKQALTCGLELIRGIEFSSHLKGEEIHILGYFRDSLSNKGNLLSILEELKRNRQNRIAEMIERLASLGIILDRDEFKATFKTSSPSRLHLAIFLKRKKIVGSIREAFKRFLAPDAPAYVGKFRYSTGEIISFLKQEKALSFLAHPSTLKKQSFLEELVDLGLDGIEVFYPGYTASEIRYYKEMASKFKLLISGGSDFHGEFKHSCLGMVKLDYSYVDNIKTRLESFLS